jgi:UDP-N-acetylmuramoylalanine--D-glutamate ligase
MIDATPFAGTTVAVLGLGRSGRATAAALGHGGAEVWAWDDGAKARIAAGDAGVPLRDLHACDWRQPAALVLSPGIPHTHPYPHPVAVAARAAGCEIIGDIEILARSHRDATFVGVTGTNGKSTTTTLIGHILEAAGRTVQVGGNLGTPALAFEPLGNDGTYVLEMSSYQLELTHSLVFDVAVLLNLSPDHLDRHGGMDGYAAAKKRIFAGQKASHTAIVGIDDDGCRAIFDDLRRTHAGPVVPISATDPIDPPAVPTLPGAHNRQNAAAASAVARAFGIDSEIVADGIRGYPGLAHRQEQVAVVDGVAYVNDSKATNPDAVARALACYDAIYWIAGGLPKEGGLKALEPHFHRVRHAFLIGEAADAFARGLEGKVAFTKSMDLATAISQARCRARKEGLKNPVVLLSPACASFDQFTDFEARGDAFRHLVEALG